MVEWQSVLEAEKSHDEGPGLLQRLVELSAERRSGDWEVVEHEGRFLLKSARWLQDLPDVAQARRRAPDLLDAILGVITVLDSASRPKIKLGNTVKITNE